MARVCELAVDSGSDYLNDADALTAEDIETYMQSADRFMSLDSQVDVELSNHVAAEGTVENAGSR